MQNTATSILIFIGIAGIPFWMFLLAQAIRWAKYPRPATKPARLFAIAILFLSIAYCVWNWLTTSSSWGGSSVVPYWPIYNPVPALLEETLFFGLLILAIVWLRWRFRLLLLLGAILFTGTGSLLGFYSASHVESAQFGNHVYHLARYTDDHGLLNYMLCECDSLGKACRCHYFFRGSSSIEPTKLIVDNEASELHVQIGNAIVYTDGKSPRCLVTYGCIGAK